jgi:hypothetical protein
MYRIILGGNEKDESRFNFNHFLMLMAACSSEDVSQRKVDTTDELSPETMTLEPTQLITENEMMESNQDIQLINGENNSNVETQSLLSSQSVKERENEI